MKQSVRARKKQKAAERREMIIIGIIATVIIAAIVIFTFSLKSSVTENEEKIARLENQIEEENDRASELDDEEAFMDSNEFIEKIARERLGLISPNETIVKPDN